MGNVIPDVVSWTALRKKIENGYNPFLDISTIRDMDRSFISNDKFYSPFFNYSGFGPGRCVKSALYFFYRSHIFSGTGLWRTADPSATDQ